MTHAFLSPSPADANVGDPIRHLYIHIPFCPQKCSYCAFVTHVGPKLMEPYLEALAADLRGQARHPRAGPLETRYFGGGTPSLMSADQLAMVMATIGDALGFESRAEVTIEAHPDTVDKEKLRRFRNAGANRISFGGESLHQGELEALGRAHSPQRVIEVVAEAKRAGFDGVALDLMYGLPRQTLVSWRETLARAVASEASHLSLYPLQIEPGTVFGRQWREGGLIIPDDDVTAEMYAIACEFLKGQGFVHYELSSWTRGSECRHNLAYWHNDEWFAVGVGAHAHVRPFRSENLRSVSQYISAISKGASPKCDEQRVDETSASIETTMLRLRLLQEGLDIEAFKGGSGRCFWDSTADLVQAGLLRRDGPRVFLSEQAVPVGNEVILRCLEALTAPGVALM